MNIIHENEGAAPQPAPEFSGLKGRFFAWFLTSPMRRLLELKMGRPEARIEALLGLNGSEQVLDFGSGSGFHTLRVAELLPEGAVVAVDVSQEMLDRLERNAAAAGLSSRVTILLADGLRLPLPDGSFDRALSAAVWHHLDDPQQAARELFRALRPGGRAVVSDLRIEANKKAIAGLEGHDRGFGPDDMRRILTEAGFVDAQVEMVGEWVVGAGDKPGGSSAALFLNT